MKKWQYQNDHIIPYVIVQSVHYPSLSTHKKIKKKNKNKITRFGYHQNFCLIGKRCTELREQCKQSCCSLVISWLFRLFDTATCVTIKNGFCYMKPVIDRHGSRRGSELWSLGKNRRINRIHSGKKYVKCEPLKFSFFISQYYCDIFVVCLGSIQQNSV